MDTEAVSTADIASLILSAALAVVLFGGTGVVFCKPDRLRFTEVPAWLLAVLAGPEARRRLRRIMDSRERAEREAIRARVERDIDAGREAARRGMPELPGLAAVRACGVPMAQAGRNLAEGLRVALAPSAPGAFETLVKTLREGTPCSDSGCADAGHEVLWVQGRGRLCLTCERTAQV